MSNYMESSGEFTSDNLYGGECPIIYALDIVGQKWRLPILWYLLKNETTRYNELYIWGEEQIKLNKSK